MADGACGGNGAPAIEPTHGVRLEVVCHPGNRSTGSWQDAQQPRWPKVVAKSFVVQAKRWERRAYACLERTLPPPHRTP